MLGNGDGACAGGSLLPLELMPGFATWGEALPGLLARPEPLWLHGPTGSGVSFLGNLLAAQRGVAFLDDADSRDAAYLDAWMREHPRAVFGSHRSAEDPAVAWAAQRCVAFGLEPFGPDRGEWRACLEWMAREEGLEGELPPELDLMPCPGNLRGLRNRLVRYRLLGQLPRPAAPGPELLPLEDDNLAANLHVLERQLLHRALRRSYGNRVEAAKRLGVSRRQLYLLVARHGDPVRGEAAVDEGPKRLRRSRDAQNSRPGGGGR